MKKIVILGANGAIGRYMVDYFLERSQENGFSLITADINCRDVDFIKSRSVCYQVDVRNKEDFKQFPKDIYAIIDLATYMPARMAGFNPQHYVDTNIKGTLNVLEFCKENQVDRLLFAQTFGDVLMKSENNPILKADMRPELDYSDIKSIYISTMNCAVELIKCYHGLFALKTFLFRLPTIYSWNSKPYYENGVETKKAWRILIDQATRGEDIYVWGDPNRQKDMVYVKDLCQMFYKACFVERDYGFYNIGTGIGTTLLDQIKGMIEVFGEDKKSNILFSPEKPNAPQYIMDISGARKELGYDPQYYYLDMLKDMKRERDLGRF